MNTKLSKLKFTLLSLGLATHALAFKADLIEVTIHPNLQDRVELEMELQTGLFKNKDIKTVRAPLSEIRNSISLGDTYNVKAINYRLNWISDTNVGADDQKSGLIAGRLVLKGNKNFVKDHKIKKEKIDISSTEKFKIDLDCSDTIDASGGGSKTLQINLTKLQNLSQCKGKDIPLYSLDHIQKRGTGEGTNRYTMEDDYKMGRDFAVEFNRENASILLPVSHPMSRYMQLQMEKIAAVSDRPDIKPVVRVINADVLNAFALPGGYIYVFRGLLEKAPNFNAVMGVLGHEWAHVTARHGTRGMTRARRALTRGAIFALAGVVTSEIVLRDKEDSKNPELRKLLRQSLQVASVGVGIGGAFLYIMDRGREQELEADRIGAQYAHLAGFNPNGVAEMFKEFKRLSPRDNTWLENLISSHPEHDERIERNLIQSALFHPKAEVPLVYAIEDNNAETILYDDALAQLSQMPLPNKEESEKIGLAFVEKFSSLNESHLLETMGASEPE
jgi:Zn-dependent protease with chaperone function